MDRATCLHCGSTSLETILRYQSRIAFRCEECNGFFNDPGSDTDALYDHDYYLRNYLPLAEAQLRESRRQMDVIRSIAPGGSVLDYGCGTGIFLRAAIEHGHARSVGADVSIDGLRIARRNVGDDVQLVHLPTERLPERQFEVIALMDALSALRNPREIVMELRDRHLAENGVLVIRTPCLPPSYFRGAALLSKAVGRKHGSSLMFAKARYMLFDTRSLRRFVESLGFAVVNLMLRREHPHPLRFDTIGGFLQTLLLRLFYARMQSIFLIARVKR